MDSLFSIIGLLLTSASAIWLLAHEIKERDLRGNKLQKRNDLIVHRESMRHRLEEVQGNLRRANETLDPSGKHQRYSVEQMTQDVRRDVEEAQRKVAEADRALAATPAVEWPQPVHFGAFTLLLVGFLCQLVAELIRAFGSAAHGGG